MTIKLELNLTDEEVELLTEMVVEVDEQRRKKGQPPLRTETLVRRWILEKASHFEPYVSPTAARAAFVADQKLEGADQLFWILATPEV